MKKWVLPLIVASSLILSGCATTKTSFGQMKIVDAPALQRSPLAESLMELPEIDGPQMTVSVYGFLDRTGQRKGADNYASFSSAVTQGAESWLIESLQLAGNGKWFRVLERAGLDNLIKERQMYRQAREEFNSSIANITPMLFAGIIAEGGVISYDTNFHTGGLGASIMGIGAQKQYRKDVITVSLRFVSTNTGEVLLSVATTKTVYSTSVSGTALAFIENGTKYGEAEIGIAGNEPVNLALRAAIDSAVISIVKAGAEKGYWKFKETPTQQ